MPPSIRMFLAGDIASAIACEQRDQLGHLLRCAVTSHRNPLTPFLRFGQTVDKAGQNIVHADIVGAYPNRRRLW